MYRIETLPVYSTLEYVPDDLKNDDIQRHMITIIIRQFKEQCYEEQEYYINKGIEHRNSGYAKMQENMFKRKKQKLQIEREKKAMEKRMESQLAHFPDGPEREKMRIILWERELEKKHHIEGLNDEIMKERERYLERQSKLLAKRQGILPGSVHEKTQEFVELKTAEDMVQLVKASALEASIADGTVENDNNAGDFFEDDDSDSDGSYMDDEYYSSDNSSGTGTGSDSGTGSEGDSDDDGSVDSEVSKISRVSATSKSIHGIQDNEQLAMEQRSNGSRSARSENSRRSKLSEKLQLPLQGSKLSASDDAELTDRTEYTYHEGGRSRLNSARSAYSDDYYSAQSSARSDYSDYSTDSQGSTPRSDYSSRSGRSGYSQSTRSDYTSSTMYSARSDYSYDETPRTRASTRSDSRYSSTEPSSARTIEILSDDDEDDHSSFRSIRSRSSTPRSTRPFTAETENSYDRPSTPYSSRPSTAESDYSNDRPYTRETDDSYDRPYTKETNNTFRPLTGETADSFVSPRDSARSKRSDGSKKPDTARSRIDDVMQAQETKYLQKLTKSEGSEKRSSHEDNDKDGSIVDSNSFASQGMMNRSINSHEMNRSLSLSLTSLGTGDTRTRAQKKRADLYGPAPDLSVEKNTKYRPDSGYSSRSDYSQSEYSRSQNSARSDYSSVSSRTRNTSDTESSYSRGGTPPSTNRSGRSASSYDSRTPRSRLPSGDDDEYERLPTDRSGFSDHSYYSRDSSRPNTGLSLSARISGMAHIDDKNNHNKHYISGSTHSSTGGSISTTHLDGSTSISSRINQGLDKNEFERKRKEQRIELLASNNDDNNNNGIKFPQIKR